MSSSNSDPYTTEDLAALRTYLEVCTSIPPGDRDEILSAVSFDAPAFFENTPASMTGVDFRTALERWRSR